LISLEEKTPHPHSVFALVELAQTNRENGDRQNAWPEGLEARLTSCGQASRLSDGLESLVQQSLRENPLAGTGKVYLIGAGPGAPGLITLRGVECLRRADVVLYDYLVNSLILAHSPDHAEKICLGKHGETRIWTQDEINAELVRLATAGKNVVRLKGGDPAVFGRAAEETHELVQHGIPFEVVPGVTAAVAASSYAGIPITHRGMASAVALVTGQEGRGKTDPAIDYGSLASFPGTLVFYMGVTTVEQWTKALLDAGKPATTPAVIVRRCSLPDQLTVRTTLGELTEQLTPATRIRPPVIVIIGEVASLGGTSSWFERRPLFGRRILVTRPVKQAGPLVDQLEELGAEVFCQPAIAIDPVDDWSAVDREIGQLSKFDWLVFSSTNGVDAFLSRLWELGKDARALAGVRIAAVGPGTRDALHRFRLHVDAQPETFQGDDLAETMRTEVSGKRVLIVRTNRGRDVVARQLTAAEAEVVQVVAYKSVDVTTPADEISNLLAEQNIDWITVTSSAIARSLHAMFGSLLQHSRLVSISPVTSNTMRELKLPIAAEAHEATMQGIVAAIVRSESKSDC
jgi:uroporphyrinogen III methyltransferase/synthase